MGIRAGRYRIFSTRMISPEWRTDAKVIISFIVQKSITYMLAAFCFDHCFHRLL
jgi:hypothetical protein